MRIGTDFDAQPAIGLIENGIVDRDYGSEDGVEVAFLHLYRWLHFRPDRGPPRGIVVSVYVARTYDWAITDLNR